MAALEEYWRNNNYCKVYNSLRKKAKKRNFGFVASLRNIKYLNRNHHLNISNTDLSPAVLVIQGDILVTQPTPGSYAKYH